MESSNLEKSENFSIKDDFNLSIKLYFENSFPFIIVLGIGVFIDFVFILFIEPLFGNYNPKEGSVFILSLTKLLINIPADSISFGFFGGCMGLGYDILSSGDEFTEAKNAIYYIKRYWGKFFTLSLIVNIFHYISYFINWSEVGLFWSIILRIFSYFWFLLLVGASPSLVSNEKLSIAFREDIILIKKRFKKIFIEFSIYYMIFLVPTIVLSTINNFFVSETPLLHFNIESAITVLRTFYKIVGLPIFAFLSLSLYNSEIAYAKK